MAGVSEHSHHHHAPLPKNKLLQAMGVTFAITVAQVIGGLVSGSLALISDALHTVTDSVALIASFVAIKLGERPASPKSTFGLKRAEIVAAAANAAVLAGISIWLIIEAIERFITPADDINIGIMVGVAAIGMIANIISSLLLRAGAKENLNMRSAYLHVMSDAIISLAVIVGGLLIAATGAHWIDPLLTLGISFWLLRASGKIVAESTRILMMVSPPGLDLDEIREKVLALPSICGMHHAHLWSFDDRLIHLECHVDVDQDLPLSETTAIIDQIEKTVHEEFGIHHLTVQLEYGRCGETPLIVDHGAPPAGEA